MKEDGTVDYYYYIAPDTDDDNNPLVGATVYIDGQKASIVSIASIPVNSDHTENEYHGKYFARTEYKLSVQTVHLKLQQTVTLLQLSLQ